MHNSVEIHGFFCPHQILREINLSEWKKDVNGMTIFVILNLLELVSRKILRASKNY